MGDLDTMTVIRDGRLVSNGLRLQLIFWELRDCGSTAETAKRLHCTIQDVQDALGYAGAFCQQKD